MSDSDGYQAEHDMNQDLEDLQTHIAFQEHTIAQLNEALISQQKQLDQFRLELLLLRQKLGEVEQGLDSKPLSAAEERPPHY
jgi:SlyX protein